MNISQGTEVEVSVIMPLYNGADYVIDAVKSVLAQTYRNFELILIDDCSKDDGLMRVKKTFADERIRCFVNQENKGVAYTRNYGVSQAKGKWIAFLDSDDLWDRYKLEKQMKLVSDFPQVKLCFTGSGFITETGEGYDYILHVPERITLKEVLKQNLISCSSVLVDKDLYMKYPMPEIGKMHEDFASWIGILRETGCAYGIDEPLLKYRITSGSKSGNKIKAAMMNWNTYRYVGLNLFEAIYYMIIYSIRSLKKYRSIKRSS